MNLYDVKLIYVPFDEAYNIELEKLDDYDYYNCNKTMDAIFDHRHKYKAVPITFMDKYYSYHGRFELIDCVRPKLHGKALYQRLLIKDNWVKEKEVYEND